ncbi:MAG: tRNA threonylcarbamoyladenosine dehydratase [Planctomycetia bacterium]|nr:tRNA threonylcarbamoyladenosine dehydratase [Planctomycetia bacterium]
MSDRFSRIRQFIGEDALQKLHHSRVLIVGLGAVGGYALEGLARAGIGHFRLVDFDVVQLSNINRQLFALESTLGQKKCEVAKTRVLDINPACKVQTLPIFVHEDTFHELFSDFTPDYVVDAIDALSPKVALMAYLQEHGIPSISSMGAALRTDPTQIRIGKLRNVKGCPLARMIKKRMRNQKIPMNSLCVYSTEDISSVRLSRLAPPEPSAPGEVLRGRPRNVLGSLPTLTGMFGLVIANHVIQQLISEPIFPQNTSES